MNSAPTSHGNAIAQYPARSRKRSTNACGDGTGSPGRRPSVRRCLSGPAADQLHGELLDQPCSALHPPETEGKPDKRSAGHEEAHFPAGGAAVGRQTMRSISREPGPAPTQTIGKYCASPLVSVRRRGGSLLGGPDRLSCRGSRTGRRSRRYSAQRVDDYCCRARHDRRTRVPSDDAALLGHVDGPLKLGLYLLDVREDDEWAAGHAPEAVHPRRRDRGAERVNPQDRECT